METLKIDKQNTKMIAHRGLSGLEQENTVLAFIAAGNRSYFGIETDVRITKDKKFILCHDDNLKGFLVLMLRFLRLHMKS